MTRLYYLRVNNSEPRGPYNYTEANMLARRERGAFVELFKQLTREVGFPSQLEGKLALHCVYIDGTKKAAGLAAKQLSKYHLGVDR